MRKIGNSIILLSIIGVLGMVIWPYLPSNADQQSSTNHNGSPDLIKSVNDGLYKLIKNDPAIVYRMNKIVESSPYLKSQKTLFIEKHYSKSTAISISQKEKMLELYMISQMKNKQLIKSNSTQEYIK